MKVWNESKQKFLIHKFVSNNKNEKIMWIPLMTVGNQVNVRLTSHFLRLLEVLWWCHLSVICHLKFKKNERFSLTFLMLLRKEIKVVKAFIHLYIPVWCIIFQPFHKFLDYHLTTHRSINDSMSLENAHELCNKVKW